MSAVFQRVAHPDPSRAGVLELAALPVVHVERVEGLSISVAMRALRDVEVLRPTACA